MAIAERGEPAHEVSRLEVALLAPAVHAHRAALGRDVRHEQPAIGGGRLAGEGRVAHERGADRDAGGTRLGKALDGSHAAHAAAHVDLDARHAADGADGRLVRRAGCLVLLEGRGEVHHVDPVRAPRGEVARHGDGIGGVDVHLGALALLEADNLPRDEVNGRKDDHETYPLTTRTKLRRMVRPVVEDFSGWNCTPKTLSDQTAEANVLV